MNYSGRLHLHIAGLWKPGVTIWIWWARLPRRSCRRLVGTLRDVLLDRRPLYWVAHPSYPFLVFVLTVVVQVAFRGRLPSLGGTWWLITDALGLGLFRAAGVSIAVEQGLPLFPASLFGVITATFGGVLRDVICAQVPGIFKRGQLYATCAFAGAWVFILLQAVLPGAAPVFTCITVAAGLRLAAVRFDLTLPA